MTNRFERGGSFSTIDRFASFDGSFLTKKMQVFIAACNSSSHGSSWMQCPREDRHASIPSNALPLYTSQRLVHSTSLYEASPKSQAAAHVTCGGRCGEAETTPIFILLNIIPSLSSAASSAETVVVCFLLLVVITTLTEYSIIGSRTVLLLIVLLLAAVVFAESTPFSHAKKKKNLILSPT